MKFKTEPRPHQLKEFETSKDTPGRCLWWDMQSGKSKVIVDTAAHLFKEKKIDGVLIMAPGKGEVHQKWIDEEFEAHLVDEVREDFRPFVWESNKAGQKGFQSNFEKLMAANRKLKVLSMTYSGIMAPSGRGAKAARKFLDSGPKLYVVDESTDFKTPNTKTAKRIVASQKYAPFRRVLNGTPVDDAPFQAYTQARFADLQIWNRLFGIQNFEAFKAYFGKWVAATTWNPVLMKEYEYPKLVEYRNLDQLYEAMNTIGSRVSENDLDLVPKSYELLEFDLNEEQRRMYDELEGKYRAWFGDGSRVTASLAIVRQTRLQQICSGYLPADKEDGLRLIGGSNPRLAALMKKIKELDEQVIIWAKYTIDVDEITNALDRAGYTFSRYDGQVPKSLRPASKKNFMEGHSQFFVAKNTAAGRGLSLPMAAKTIYYNNGFSLDKRRQSEKRNHGITQTRPVKYFDIIAKNTVDRYILEVLKKKRDVAACVMGDELPPWVI